MKYKKDIHDHLKDDMIDKSLHVPIDSEDEDYIMRKIREDYLSDSTVTIFLIGEKSAENTYGEDQSYLKRELQASLYHGEGNTRNGILGVVLPEMYDRIYNGSSICSTCGKSHNHIKINHDTVISEFAYNYYIPNNKCAWNEDDRYCVLVRWDDFLRDPKHYINSAFNKRNHKISSKIRVRP